MLVRPSTASRRGLTTVELLIVMAIIGVVLTISIPALVRMGVFGGQKAELAGRELFTMLRAARVHATTFNAETAVVYGIEYTSDSANDGGPVLPIATSYAIVRKVRREEIERNVYPLLVDEVNAINGSVAAAQAIQPTDVYVPIEGVEGSFKRFENETCVLPDIFEVYTSTNNNETSNTGLQDIVVWDPISEFFMTPVFDYRVGGASNLPNSFPAHVFQVNGALSAVGLPRQRVTLRAGLRPDSEIADRFLVEPEFLESAGELLVRVGANIIDASDSVFYKVYIDTNGNPLDLDAKIDLYAAMGRVKMRDTT